MHRFQVRSTDSPDCSGEMQLVLGVYLAVQEVPGRWDGVVVLAVAVVAIAVVAAAAVADKRTLGSDMKTVVVFAVE